MQPNVPNMAVWLLSEYSRDEQLTDLSLSCGQEMAIFSGFVSSDTSSSRPTSAFIWSTTGQRHFCFTLIFGVGIKAIST